MVTVSETYNPTDETYRWSSKWRYKVHTLKTEAPYFRHVRCDAKPFEVRRDDRGFQPGDLLVLAEWEDGYTGLDVARVVTYVLRDAEDHGVQEGYVVLGLRRPNIVDLAP